MNTRAFLLQYVALLMILVAFMVGAYARRHEDMLTIPMQAQGSMTPADDGVGSAEVEFTDGDSATEGGTDATLASQFVFRDAFRVSIRHGEELVPQSLDGLVALLKSHDLRATVHVFAPSSNELDVRTIDKGRGIEGEFDRAFMRARRVAAYLLGQGLPPEAFEVLAAPTRSPVQLQVRLTSLELADG